MFIQRFITISPFVLKLLVWDIHKRLPLLKQGNYFVG